MRIVLCTGTLLILACTMVRAADVPAPVPLAVAASPTQPTLNAAGEGRRLYLKLNCYGCHSMFATGAMGPDIVHAERGDLREAVMQGQEGGMPSFRNYVDATDIDNLSAYLKSIGTPDEPMFMDWWKKNPRK
jgi:mono/diheme cytochrome c family protein